MKTMPLDEYRSLINELLILREAEGGDLPEELESSYVERLDKLWWKLTEDEREQYDSQLAGSSLRPDRRR